MWKLQILHPDQPTMSIDLAAGKELVVGRDPGADIVLPERSVSRRHCRLSGRADGVEVVDLGSANGVYVGGRPVQRILLGSDGECQVGMVKIRISRPASRTGMIPLVDSSTSDGATSDTTIPPAATEAGASILDPRRAEYKNLDQNRLALLIEAGKSLSATHELDALLDRIMEHLFQILPVKRGVLVLLDADGKLHARKMRPQGTGDLSEFCSQHIIREVIAGGHPRIIEDASLEEKLREAKSILAADIKAAICAPLVSSARALGALYADYPGRARLYGASDLDFFGAFAGIAAVALENARMQSELRERERLHRDLEIAAEIQKGLLPDATLEMRGVEMDWAYWPARQIGGDFYDCHMVGDDRVALVLGDVSGKSIGAALFMARLVSFLRATMLDDPTPGAVLSRTNALLGSRDDQVVFATACYLLIDPAQKKLKYASAGHLPALLLEPGSDTFRELPPSGIPLGLDTSFVYEGRDADLPPGSLVLLYTDGILEARDKAGVQFGLERIQGIVLEQRNSTVREITQALVGGVTAHCRGSTYVRDDIAILTARLAASPA